MWEEDIRSDGTFPAIKGNWEEGLRAGKGWERGGGKVEFLAFFSLVVNFFSVGAFFGFGSTTTYPQTYTHHHYPPLLPIHTHTHIASRK